MLVAPLAIPAYTCAFNGCSHFRFNFRGSPFCGSTVYYAILYTGLIRKYDIIKLLLFIYSGFSPF